MIYKNEDRKFGELSEYFGIYPEREIKEVLKCKGLLFTERELELAKNRWERKGKPDLKDKFLGIFG